MQNREVIITDHGTVIYMRCEFKRALNGQYHMFNRAGKLQAYGSLKRLVRIAEQMQITYAIEDALASGRTNRIEG